MRVLGVNAIYHDPAAALVVHGEIVAAAEEERSSRRRRGPYPESWVLDGRGETVSHLVLGPYLVRRPPS